MKLATYRLPADARGTPFDAAIVPGTSWAQFGDEVLLVADDRQWKPTARQVRSGELRLYDQWASLNKERLYVVVQNGRLFQQEHPNVPVILDHGRFLLVDLDPDRARQLEDKSSTCYGLLPLVENQVIFDTL